MRGKRKVAYAALDIGTSQVKLGVYCPQVSPEIILINNYRNELIYGSAGVVRAKYEVVREKSFLLLKELGGYLKTNGIDSVSIGICGHVSSLLEWNKSTDTPPAQPFPIWLDTTCQESLPEYDSIMGGGRSKTIIGTFLPAGTNWLFTKLLHRRRSGFSPDKIFLQVADAIFYELTGSFFTHFSSQISMVNLIERQYAKELLSLLGIDATALPTISYQPLPLIHSCREMFDLPQESVVFPAMADLYTSLYGLQLKDREGFMLANTSEQAGIFFQQQPAMPDKFLSISFEEGFINYGSTNTGGNVVQWLVETVLGRKLTAEVLEELTNKAALVHPAETPILLPYLQGERAPLWNSTLTASFLELNGSHTAGHLFRAVLESIAFARRQCFEQLGRENMDVIKLAGGSSKNQLWNTIRATIINKELAVANETELAMAGIIYYVMSANGSAAEKPAIRFSSTSPDLLLAEEYDRKYARFLKYQNLLS